MVNILVVCTYNTVQYTIREAAKVSGLWDKAPYMEEISPESFRKFYDHVSSALYCYVYKF